MSQILRSIRICWALRIALFEVPSSGRLCSENPKELNLLHSLILDTSNYQLMKLIRNSCKMHREKRMWRARVKTKLWKSSNEHQKFFSYKLKICINLWWINKFKFSVLSKRSNTAHNYFTEGYKYSKVSINFQHSWTESNTLKRKLCSAAMNYDSFIILIFSSID